MHQHSSRLGHYVPSCFAIALMVSYYAPLAAQANIITACYPHPLRTGAPGSGQLYRLDKPAGSAPGAPAACQPRDIEFTWNQVGPTGPTGPAGPAGPQGASGVSGYEFISQVVVSVPAGTTLNNALSCPAGKVATGGGYRDEGEALHILWDTPIDGGTGWYFRVTNPSQFNDSFSMYVICVTAS